MRKLVLVCGILVSVVSVGMGAMSDEEWQRARHNCLENEGEAPPLKRSGGFLTKAKQS